jgi:hypothetical protein
MKWNGDLLYWGNSLHAYVGVKRLHLLVTFAQAKNTNEKKQKNRDVLIFNYRSNGSDRECKGNFNDRLDLLVNSGFSLGSLSMKIFELKWGFYYLILYARVPFDFWFVLIALFALFFRVFL